MSDSLDRIYRSIPTVACKGLCTEACGPLNMSEVERQRIADRGVDIPTPDVLIGSGSLTCPALVDGRCSVYEVRPLICRLWGAVESLPCPHGCEVTPGLLMDAGAHALLRRSLRLEPD
jgi:Fe-S-cluster containining protein